MKTVLRALGAVLAALLVLVGVFVGWNWSALTTFPGMASSYEAKEYCSCLFVSERPEAFCDRFVRQSTVPTQGREIDASNKTVTARALWVSNTARWVDRRRGCVLER